MTNESTSLIETLRIQHWTIALVTILFGLVGAGIYAILNAIEMPYIMVSLFKFGLSPAIVIIALIGGIRGPLAGFLTGYIGVIVYDLVVFHTVLNLTLPALAYGVLGVIVGLASYDFTNGRSLAKLSILSTIGLVFTALLLVVIGLFVQQISVLAVLGFVMLPLLTVGIPSVILIAPVLARLWYILDQKVEL